jgi:hypothetical protein
LGRTAQLFDAAVAADFLTGALTALAVSSGTESHRIGLLLRTVHR